MPLFSAFTQMTPAASVAELVLYPSERLNSRRLIQSRAESHNFAAVEPRVDPRRGARPWHLARRDGGTIDARAFRTHQIRLFATESKRCPALVGRIQIGDALSKQALMCTWVSRWTSTCSPI